MIERVQYVDVTCSGCGTALRRRKSDVERLKTGRVFCGRDCPGAKAFKPRRGEELTCPECGNKFYRRPSETRGKTGRSACCSRPCSARLTARTRSEDGRITLEARCETCKGEFTHPRSQGARRFCSLACSGNANTKTKLACQWCGGDYVGRPQERRFCSRPCFYAHQAANAQGTITKSGYRNIWVNGKQIPEHRHVMQVFLGHSLPPNSTVHHKDLDKLNNTPENLELWASVHPKGARVLDLLDYARMVLETFGPDESRLRELDVAAVS